MVGLFFCSPTIWAAENEGISTNFIRQFHQQLQFKIIRGQVVVSSQRNNGRWQSSSRGSGFEERLSVDTTTGKPSIDYFRRNQEMQFQFKIENSSTLSIHRERKGAVELDFKQDPDGGVELTVMTEKGSRTVLSASMWHLLLSEPEMCQNHLLPVLEPVRSGWPLKRWAAELEELLLRTVIAHQNQNQVNWGEIVQLLADEQFSTRQRADRELRNAGETVLPYLQGLDPRDLDAEQRYRIRRIISSLTGDEEEDLPGEVASRLSSDPAIWVELLDRDELKTRRLAAEKLASLWGRDIVFEPEAPEEVRKAQIAQLRLQLPPLKPRMP